MDAETRKEAKLRTVKLESHEAVKASLNSLMGQLFKLYAQTHETIDGKRVKLSKRRKIAKANKLIDDALLVPDIEQDTINQLRAMDRD